VVIRRQLKRRYVLAFFQKLTPRYSVDITDQRTQHCHLLGWHGAARRRILR
jgi:hypothetical protein